MNIKRLIYNKHYINNYPLNERTIFDFCKSEGMEYIIKRQFREIKEIKFDVDSKKLRFKKGSQTYHELCKFSDNLEEFVEVVNFYKKTANDIKQMKKNIYDIINDYDVYMNDAIRFGYRIEPNTRHQQSNLFVNDTNDMLHTYRYNFFISLIVNLWKGYKR